MLMMAFALAEHQTRPLNSWNECPSPSGVEISSLCPALSILNSQAEIKIRDSWGGLSAVGLVDLYTSTGLIKKYFPQGFHL